MREAREKFPEAWDIAKYESDLVQQMDGPAAALAPVEQYARERWWHQASWLTLGQLRLAAQDFDGAAAALRHAAKLDIHDARPFLDIARIELSRNHLDAAREAQQTAIDRDPNQPSRYLVLADILDKLGRKTEAAAAIKQAETLRASVRGDGA